MKISNFTLEVLEQFKGVIYNMLDAYIRSNHYVIKVENNSYLCNGENDAETIEKRLIDFLQEKNIDTSKWSVNVECNSLELMSMYEFSISVMPSEEIESANDDEFCDDCKTVVEDLIAEIADDFQNDIKTMLLGYFSEKYDKEFIEKAAYVICCHQWSLVTDKLKITEPRA